jgi:hypothetical protein
MGKVLSKKNMNCLFKFCCLLLVLYLLYAVLKPVLTEGATFTTNKATCSGDATAGFYGFCGTTRQSDISYSTQELCNTAMSTLGISCESFDIDCACTKTLADSAGTV